MNSLTPSPRSTPSMPDITLLCSDGPHHLYLAAEILKTFGKLRLIVEPGHAQASRLWRDGHYRAYGWTLYHQWRRGLFGYNAYRQRYFTQGEAPLTWDALRRDPCVRLIETPWINDPCVVETLREEGADAYIVMGTKKIGAAVLAQIPPERILNLHGGHLPHYKGNHCFFFALHHGEFDKLSTTLHRVASGLDTGAIVSHHTVQFQQGDNSETLYSRAEKRAVDNLVARLKMDPDVTRWDSEPQPNAGATYRMRDRGPLVEIAHRFALLRHLHAASAVRRKRNQAR
ncbi:formyl transferase [Paraburkholderia dilworthii]|uniref:phosphoribosylglycinamide formyltransferase 1 n=1 Tax=Paraburkholderia dilworthii TaxID=948106 RepID=A0ABW9D6K5_9BURK